MLREAIAVPWTEEKIRLWRTPAPEVLTLIQRWKEKGFERVLDRGCGPGRHSICFVGQGFSVTIQVDAAAERAAELRGTTPEKIMESSTNNAKKLFFRVKTA